jgi:hypothetical protein
MFAKKFHDFFPNKYLLITIGLVAEGIGSFGLHLPFYKPPTRLFCSH